MYPQVLETSGQALFIWVEAQKEWIKLFVKINEGKFKNGETDYELMKCHVSDQKSSFWYIIQFVQNFNFILTSSWMYDGTPRCLKLKVNVSQHE